MERICATFVMLVMGTALTFALPAIMPYENSALLAHPGGLAKDGCHNDRKAGTRHCHGGKAKPAKKQPPANGRTYRNCSEARAAGAAPVKRGDPGYGRHLDRDNDGIGCE